MSQFTAGTWKYIQSLGVVYSEDTSAVIASVRGAGTGSCFCLTQEGQANARLIAAAPEMHELLKVWTQIGAEPTLKNARKRAEELLARIDGEEAKDDCD